MHIAIIGGGIGGLTAAIALRRAGFEAEVYEAAPVLDPVGRGIWVPTNAMRVLDALGVAEHIAAAGRALEGIEIQTVSGVRLQTIDLRAVVARLGHTTISIHRAALQQALVAALPAGTLHLGAQCVGVSTDGDAASLRFADASSITADLVVGADGIKSRVRREVTADPPLRYLGQTAYLGIAQMALPEPLAHSCIETWGGSLRFGFSALAADRVYWFAPVSAAADPAAAAPSPRHLLDLGFHAFPPPVPDILAATPAPEVLRVDLHELPPLGHWQRGRAVLVGDAAHAMAPNLGQGGAQAIEDALALARALRETAEMAPALQRYESQRRARVRWIADRARLYGRLAHLESAALRRFRDLAIRGTPAWLTKPTLDWLYRGEA